MPAGSKTDWPLIKAELFSNSGSASVITYLRRGKNCCGTAFGREEWEYVRETTLQTSRWAEKEETEVPQCRSRDSPAAHGEDHGDASCPLAAHGGPQWSRWMCPDRSCSLWTAHVGAGIWYELWPIERSPHRSRFSCRTCGLWGTHAGVVHSWRTAARGKHPCWSRSWKIMSHSWDPILEQRKGRRRKERQRKHVMNCSQPSFPCSGWGGSDRGVTSDIEPGKKGGCGEGVFSFAFISLCPFLLLIGNKLNSSSPCQVCFSHDGSWWVISLFLSQPTSFSSHFLTNLLIKGNERAA